jgi:DNA-binding transcriptional MerR regulator
MLIGELAQKTGLSSHAIRYYEREGLLARRFVLRGENRYRHYADDAVVRISAVRLLQTAGFTLSEIRDLMERWDVGVLTSAHGAAYLQQKMDDIERRIDQRIAELEQARAALGDLAAHIASATDGAPIGRRASDAEPRVAAALSAGVRSRR